MKFDTVRQPLFTALLILITFTIVALWGAGSLEAGGAAGVGSLLGVAGETSNGDAGEVVERVVTEAVSASVATGEVVVYGAGGGEYLLAIPSLGELLMEFQTLFPIWSLFVTGFLILFTGVYVGHIAVRYNLYAVSSCLPISLYAIVACGIGISGDYLAAFTAAALLAITIKNYSSSYCNEYRFDALFSASFSLGILAVVYSQALPLVLLLPHAIMIFRCTVREIIVAVAGLVLPLLVISYVNWGAGGDFIAPLLQLCGAFASGVSLRLFTEMDLSALILVGVILLLDIFTLLVFLRNLYAVGSRPRFILLYCVGVLLITVLTLFVPIATTGAFALFALPSALLLPVLFIHVNRNIAQPVYLLLLFGTLTYMVLQ